MVLCIFAQSSIFELNRTKSWPFDFFRFNLIWFGHRIHKKVLCSISFDSQTASNSFVRLSSMKSLFDFVRCNTPGDEPVEKFITTSYCLVQFFEYGRLVGTLATFAFCQQWETVVCLVEFRTNQGLPWLSLTSSDGITMLSIDSIQTFSPAPTGPLRCWFFLP